MLKEKPDEYWMKKALEEAQIAFEKEEIPVGAIVVHKEQIVGRGHNLTELLSDVTAHAEIQAITAASNTLGSKYLDECKIYVTLEPCAMCAGALYWSRINQLIIGTKDEKRGALRFEGIYHPKTKIIEGVMESECSDVLKSFFKSKR